MIIYWKELTRALHKEIRLRVNLHTRSRLLRQRERKRDIDSDVCCVVTARRTDETYAISIITIGRLSLSLPPSLGLSFTICCYERSHSTLHSSTHCSIFILNNHHRIIFHQYLKLVCDIETQFSSNALTIVNNCIPRFHKRIGRLYNETFHIHCF